MATEKAPTNEYPLSNDSYAAFDAISLRNLIIERLNDQGVFTDQNYIGSNLAAIIDIVSYSFNTLMFYLNRTSTESMFTEAQLYENINRVVKLLDYKPIGYQTSTLSFQCSAQGLDPGIYTIPRYSYLTIGGVPFSFNEDISFNITSSVAQQLNDVSNKKLLFQGAFRETPLYTAAGDENEIVVVDNNSALIDHFNIDVYVFEPDQNRWIQYSNVPSLYVEPSFARVFEKRLNSDLTYEIMFGDGINGRRLEEGEKVVIYYLQSSGNQGVIGPNNLTVAQKSIYTSSNFTSIFNDTSDGKNFSDFSNNQFSNLFFANVVGSTIPKDIETADSIRRNAPSNFKSQYRLVTREDYQTFIKTNHSNFIKDVKVFSNWEYVNDYLRYFKDIQVSPTSYRQILLNQVLYADSCNFNNIYICATPKIAQTSSLKYLLPAQKEILLSDIQPLKTLTSEITFLDPLLKAFTFGVKSVDGDIEIIDKDFCRLEIVKLSNSKRSANSIKTEAVKVIQEFFDPLQTTLGGIHDHSELVKRLLSINGVSNILTRRLDTEEFYNGLSLFYWNPTFPDLDKAVVTNNINLKDFEYVYFESLSDVANKIDIIETTSFV